jgi:hypothetical protein
MPQRTATQKPAANLCITVLSTELTSSRAAISTAADRDQRPPSTLRCPPDISRSPRRPPSTTISTVHAHSSTRRPQHPCSIREPGPRGYRDDAWLSQTHGRPSSVRWNRENQPAPEVRLISARGRTPQRHRRSIFAFNCTLTGTLAYILVLEDTRAHRAVLEPRNGRAPDGYHGVTGSASWRERWSGPRM